MPAGAKPGERRGGRSKGTPNRVTQTIEAKLVELGCDPIEGMARLALDDKNTPELVEQSKALLHRLKFFHGIFDFDFEHFL
jgi:hypothetical protein